MEDKDYDKLEKKFEKQIEEKNKEKNKLQYAFEILSQIPEMEELYKKFKEVERNWEKYGNHRYLLDSVDVLRKKYPAFKEYISGWYFLRYFEHLRIKRGDKW